MRHLRTSAFFLMLDALLISVAWYGAFWLRFNLDVPAEYEDLCLQSLVWVLLAYSIGWGAMGLHRQVWRYTGLPELRQMAVAVLLASAMTAAAILMLRYAAFPRSVMLLHPLLVMVLLAGVRAVWRSVSERQAMATTTGSPLLIVGNLQEASDALRALKGSSQWYPVGIVSPLQSEIGRSLQDIKVLGAIDSIAAHARKQGVNTVLIASPAGSAERRELLMQSGDAALQLLTMPRPDEWLRQDTGTLRRIELEDLLGRASVDLDMKSLSGLLAGQCVMVTGAGGSIGSELCRQLARLGIARLVCVDVSEFSSYQLERELRAAHNALPTAFYTANVREAARLLAIAQAEQPAVVFHAAAYKHVPLMEERNEIEAIRTNVLGTLHAARAAGLCGAQRFVLVSTDKAVNPTNIMGATKRLAELVVQAVALEFSATNLAAQRTQFVSVRFGNVLGSSGSVVPLFTEQIARGGPVTVTHPDIVRYFMTIPEAARLVIQAGQMGQSGQIFVLDMGEPMKIAELARIMIRLSGKTEQDIPIRYTGLRPGEKLFEELLADDETTEPTPHAKLRIAKISEQNALQIDQITTWIDSSGAAPSSHAARAWLQSLVPEYQARPV
jgi:FlaA1/EpsC-like NDP-sugar epimerase